jgi:hypothetical protein
LRVVRVALTTESTNLVVTKAVFPDGRSIGTIVRATGATWSPDGTQVAFVTPSGASLGVANLQGEERTLIHSPGIFQPFYAWPVWSPDGSKVALIEVGWCEIGSRITSVVVVDVAEGSIVSSFGPHEFWMAGGTEEGPTYFTMPEALRWSPDGGKMLISWDMAVVLDFTTGEIDTISDTRVVAEWAPESDAIYYFDVRGPARGARSLSAFNIKALGADASTRLMDEGSVAALGLTGAESLVPGLLALSPTGSMLAVATGRADGGTSSVLVYDAREAEPVALDGPSQRFETDGMIVAMDWGPDEGSMAVILVGESGSTSLQVLDLATGTWNVVATPEIDVDVIDVIPTVLSWSR